VTRPPLTRRESMTKRKMTKTKNRKATNKSTRVPVVMGKGLDAAALAYRNLLVDPCNAALVHPTFASMGVQSGNLIRFEYNFTPMSGLNTDFQIEVTPSNWSSTSTDLVNFGQTTLGGTGTVGTVAGLTDIGFLQNNARWARCIAGCLQAVYTGTELNRSGWIGSALIPNSNMLLSGQTGVGTATFQNYCQVINRTGEVVHEVKFIPGVVDQRGLGNGGVSDLSASSMVMLGYGLPAGGFINFRLVLVYEWIPNGGTAVQAPTSAVASRNSLQEVLNSLGKGAWWLGQHAAPILQAAARGYAAGGYIGAAGAGALAAQRAITF